MNLPPESTILDFPCEFPIKAFGLATDEFPQLVLGIVRRHIADTPVNAMQRRVSHGGKYAAVTVTVVALSKTQLDAIYQDLTACPDVIMAL